MAHNELSHLGLHFALLSLKSLVSHFLEFCGTELVLCNSVMSVEVQFMCWSGPDIIKLFFMCYILRFRQGFEGLE